MVRVHGEGAVLAGLDPHPAVDLRLDREEPVALADPGEQPGSLGHVALGELRADFGQALRVELREDGVGCVVLQDLAVQARGGEEPPHLLGCLGDLLGRVAGDGRGRRGDEAGGAVGPSLGRGAGERAGEVDLAHHLDRGRGGRRGVSRRGARRADGEKAVEPTGLVERQPAGEGHGGQDGDDLGKVSARPRAAAGPTRVPEGASSRRPLPAFVLEIRVFLDGHVCPPQ